MKSTPPEPPKTPPQPDPIAIVCSHSRLVDPKTLRPHPQNPKKHPPEQLAVFAKILKARGIRRAVVVSKESGFVVAGHGLLETCLQLGVPLVPVDEQSFPDPDAELAHLVADNKLAELGVTSDAQLDAALRQLAQSGIDAVLAGVLKELEDEPEAEPQGVYELQPEFDEAYDGVLVFCKTGHDYAAVATALALGQTMNRKGKIGNTRVIEASQFLKLWNSRS
jgi:hypothetical protein